MAKVKAIYLVIDLDRLGRGDPYDWALVQRGEHGFKPDVYELQVSDRAVGVQS